MLQSLIFAVLPKLTAVLIGFCYVFAVLPKLTAVLIGFCYIFAILPKLTAVLIGFCYIFAILPKLTAVLIGFCYFQFTFPEGGCQMSAEPRDGFLCKSRSLFVSNLSLFSCCSYPLTAILYYVPGWLPVLNIVKNYHY